jgi:hypothetical protein
VWSISCQAAKKLCNMRRKYEKNENDDRNHTGNEKNSNSKKHNDDRKVLATTDE